MRRKYKILSLLLLSVAFASQAATPFKNENLRYVISYKWGVIHKDAGDATLSLRHSGDNYKVTLTAKTKPWADKVYMVRDTLKSTIRMRDLKPLSYDKITHEKGKYATDHISYSIAGNQTTGKVKKYREKKGEPSIKENTLTATGPVYDMLSIFYYLRQLDYSQLNKNKIYVATIFSGSKKETIRIKSLGLENVKLKNGSTQEAYHIKFNFTRDGGKKSSADMDTWISTDAEHIPLYLIGSLPIGEVRASFIGK